jgi:HAD superfamily hydrolase (TIGR01509 family)
MIKTVISDLGKVLVFFDNRIFFRKLEPYSSFSADEMEKQVLRRIEVIESFDGGRLSPREFYEKAVSLLRADIDEDLFFRFYNDVFWLNPPAVEVLARLRQGYRMVLLSNTDARRFPFIRENFPEILFFHAYVLSYEQGCTKPDPKIYEAALQAGGHPPEECVFIDDLEDNIQTAAEMGIHTLRMKEDTDLEAELKALGLVF